eukprot:PITA_24795
MNAVASTQEALFAIHSKKSDAVILKVDLCKAYDCLDWGFTRCLLAKIGLRANMIDWIMACVEGVDYAIIINRIPSSFFHAARGLRQGCPLAPLLFILAMNSLSLHINKDLLAMHLWNPKKISNGYMTANNYMKSAIFHNDSNPVEVAWLDNLFGIKVQTISLGIKYLGFQLKANGYSKVDWSWISDRYYRKISAWEYRSLTLAGRVTLAQSILNQLVGSQAGRTKYHLSKLSNISLPKSMGGWGLLDMRTFGKALLCKSLWGAIHGEGSWSSIIQKKYLGRKDLTFWFREGRIGAPYGSPIWLSFHKIENFFLKNLIWRFQFGNNILIGKDQFLSGAEEINVPIPLLNFFHRRDLFFWDSLIATWQGSIPLWKDAGTLKMPGPIALQWEHIRMNLKNCGFFCSEESDSLSWKTSKGLNGIRVKDVYLNLIGLKQSSHIPIFPRIFWKAACPPKMIFFSWLSFHNKNLSQANLKKRGWLGPGLCPICRSDEEFNDHLFLQCKGSKQLWHALENYYGVQHNIHVSITDSLLWCSEQNESWRTIFIIAWWSIWKWRNNSIFNGCNSPFLDIFLNIVSLYEALPQKSLKKNKSASRDLSEDPSFYPRAYFDGVEQLGSCGCGAIIMVNENIQFSAHRNGGKGTNSKAEAMALAGLLKLCIFLNIQDVLVFGDSKVMVDFVSGKNHIFMPHLVGWMDRISFYWGSLEGGSIHHISRELNQQAYLLSKEGLHSALGLWFLQVVFEGNLFPIQEFSFHDF